MDVIELESGYVICGDSTQQATIDRVKAITGSDEVALVVADPPYGNIVAEHWDRISEDQDTFTQWMIDWTTRWAATLCDGGAFYVWGGYGRVGFRPMFQYLSSVEGETGLEMANFLTWSKRRAYGIQWGYLQTREDLAYFVKGDHKHPRVFNVPLLDKKRGYAGYSEKYPAKSEYLRRTSVWTDVTEILRGKIHPTQKPVQLHRIIIEASSREGDWVVDPFGGSGTTAVAAEQLNRRFVVIEQDPAHVETTIQRLNSSEQRALF